MPNGVYLFFLGDAGRNIFFKMKQKEPHPSVRKMRHFDSYISWTFQEHGCAENALKIGYQAFDDGCYTVFPWRGEMAVKASQKEIRAQLKGCTTLLIVGGLGGGFGSGAASEIAKIARRMGTRAVAFMWMPFSFEGKRRAERARFYKKRLEERCNACFFCDQSTIREPCTLSNCFDLADAVIVNQMMNFLAKIQKSGNENNT